MKLTEEQNKLIESSGNIILKAGPGSGKTLRLVALINKKLKEWNIT